MSDDTRYQLTMRELAWRTIARRVASFDEGPLLWLTQFTKTEDLHWIDKGTPPVAPFPSFSYFPIVLRYILERKRVFIPKTREMMTSWLVCGYVAWSMQWHPHVQWVMQSQKEDKAFELVNYVRILYRYQPAWMCDRVSVVGDNVGQLTLSNGSEVIGIPAGEEQIRSYHPTGVVFDEMSHLPAAKQAYAIAHPVARQIIGISSVAPGFFAAECGV